MRTASYSIFLDPPELSPLGLPDVGSQTLYYSGTVPWSKLGHRRIISQPDMGMKNFPNRALNPDVKQQSAFFYYDYAATCNTVSTSHRSYSTSK